MLVRAKMRCFVLLVFCVDRGFLMIVGVAVVVAAAAALFWPWGSFPVILLISFAVAVGVVHQFSTLLYFHWH